jgi:hypothetical protein
MGMPEILLDGAGIDAFVREVKATGMAQHIPTVSRHIISLVASSCGY